MMSLNTVTYVTVGNDILFGRSAIRRAILVRFVLRPGLERHARELAREMGRAAQPVARELVALERAGVLVSGTVGRAKRYRFAESSPIASQVRDLVRRTIGVEGRLHDALEGLPGVEEAFVFGSYARGEDRATSDIDLMVVGTVTRRALSERLREVENDLGRDVNVTRYTREDLDRLRGARDPFVADVWGGKRIPIIARREGS